MLRLERELTERVESAARRYQLTPNTLVQGAWALLLAAYSGESDVVFGTTDSGRRESLAGAESLVGLCINSLPTRVRIGEHAKWVTWLKELQDQQVEQRQFTYFSLASVQRTLRWPGGVPFFESLLVFENYPISFSQQELQFAASPSPAQEPLVMRATQHFLNEHLPFIFFIEPGSEMTLRMKVQAGRFGRKQVERLLLQLELLMEQFVERAEVAVAEVRELIEADFRSRFAGDLEQLRFSAVPRSTAITNEHPLSFHQERLWFIDCFEAGEVYESHPTYHNIALLLELRGAVDAELMERSLDKLVDRHALLRTRIVTKGARGVQVVGSPEEFELRRSDLSGSRSLAAVREEALMLARCPFALGSELLFRGQWLRMSETES